jgi:molybdopterin/thiamine biosynthesis adenylyltransferase
MHNLTPEFSRNLGFLSESEQHILTNSTVAIAGAGGDGGMLAVQLARLGVGELRLADPDPFELENINRQACATHDTVGENKAVAVGRYAQAINPRMKVAVYDEGITFENVQQFVEGSDLVIDETEFTIHALGVMLARAAREENVPNLMAMNIGFGATVTSFMPNGMTFEKMIGLTEKASIDEIEESQPAISRWLPYIPPYGDLAVFEKVATEEKSAPSIAPGVAMAAGMAATQSLLHLLAGQNNRPSPIKAPKVLVMDAMTGQGKVQKLSRSTHYYSLAKMAVRNKLKLVPKASY